MKYFFAAFICLQLSTARAKVNRLLDERHKKVLAEKTDESAQFCLLEINLMLRELLFAHRFNDATKDCAWLTNKSFSLRGDSANYSFMYLLFQVLDLVKPQAVLELGAGQTTRLTTQYAAHCNTQSVVTVVEHDAAWIETIKKTTAHVPRITFLELPIEKVLYKKQYTETYTDLATKLAGQRYNLIIIDGPRGSQHYSRIGGLTAADHSLADEFIIIIDDVERSGEAETAEEIAQLLQQKKINFISFAIEGEKRQRVLCSPCYSFLQSV